MTNPVRAIANSLSFRLGPVCEAIFSRLPLAGPDASPEQRFQYLAFAGRGQLPMLRASLWSLATSGVGSLPLVVACDRSTPADEMSQALAWWRGPVRIWEESQLLEYGDRHLPSGIMRFCRKTVHGLKICAIARAAAERLTIYADSDVLWFRNPSELITGEMQTGKRWLQLQQDAQRAYDPDLLELWPQLREEPFRCSGVMLANGNVASAVPDLPTALPPGGATWSNPYTEQTVLAAASGALGIPVLPHSAAFLGWEDRFRLTPSFTRKPWVLRHYVGPVRHLFWRDACYLRWLRRG